MWWSHGQDRSSLGRDGMKYFSENRHTFMTWKTLEKPELEIIVPLRSLLFKNHRMLLFGKYPKVNLIPTLQHEQFTVPFTRFLQALSSLPLNNTGMGCPPLLWATKFKGTQTGTGKQWGELTVWEVNIKFGLLNPGKFSWEVGYHCSL